MELQVKRLELALSFENGVPPFRFATNTLRGGFGYALRKVACAFRHRECEGCLAEGQCVYSYVFDTIPDRRGEFMTRYNRAPHPFVFFSNGDSVSEKNLRVELTLIGKAITFLPYFVLAMQELGRMGLGRRREPFVLEKVVELDSGRTLLEGSNSILERPGDPERFPVMVSDEPVERMEFHLLSPLRLKYNGNLLREPSFRAIVGSLLRRISSLCYFHGEGKPELDYRGLADVAESPRVMEDDTRWVEMSRFSTRQEDWMKLGGITGDFAVEGELGPFLDLLRLGEAVGIGKACTFGFGRYNVKAQRRATALTVQ